MHQLDVGVNSTGRNNFVKIKGDLDQLSTRFCGFMKWFRLVKMLVVTGILGGGVYPEYMNI